MCGNFGGVNSDDLYKCPNTITSSNSFSYYNAFQVAGCKVSGTIKTITTMEVFNGNLFLGGSFSATTVPAIDSLHGLLKYNGISFSAVCAPTSLASNIVDFAVNSIGDSLFMIGGITQMNGITSNDIIKFDGSSFYPVGSGLPPSSILVPTSIEEFNGNLFIGVDGANLSSAAPWLMIYNGSTINVAQGSDAFPANTNTADTLYNIKTFAKGNSKLFAGSSFSSSLSVQQYAITMSVTNNKFELNEFVVYPNPSNSNFNVSNIMNAELIDIQGKILRIIKSDGRSNVQINVEEPGIYFLRINGIKTVKIIKQ